MKEKKRADWKVVGSAVYEVMTWKDYGVL